jgi:hypothetical protein
MQGGASKGKQKGEAPVKAPVKRFSDDFYLYTFKIAPCKAEYPVGARRDAAICAALQRLLSFGCWPFIPSHKQVVTYTMAAAAMQ